MFSFWTPYFKGRVPTDFFEKFFWESYFEVKNGKINFLVWDWNKKGLEFLIFIFVSSISALFGRPLLVLLPPLVLFYSPRAHLLTEISLINATKSNAKCQIGFIFKKRKNLEKKSWSNKMTMHEKPRLSKMWVFESSNVSESQ